MTILNKLRALLGTFWLQIVNTKLVYSLLRLFQSVFYPQLTSKRYAIQRSLSYLHCGQQYTNVTGTVYIVALSVRKAAPPVTSTTAQQLAAALASGQTQDYWAADIKGQCSGNIVLMYAQSVPQKVWVPGFDFFIVDNTLYTRFDPAQSGMRMTYDIADTGNVESYYVANCVRAQQLPVLDIFSYITDTTTQQDKLRRCLWQTRIVGPTQTIIRRICGALLDIPVADTVQYVRDIQEQNNLWYVYTDKSMYSCRVQPCICVGDTLQPGQYITNQFRVITRNTYDKQASAISGLDIQTAVGMLHAANQQLPVQHAGTLPLQDLQPCTYTQYAQYIAGLQTKAQLPATVNAMQYVLFRICQGRFIILYVNRNTSTATVRRMQQLIRNQVSSGVCLYTYLYN